MPHFRCMKTLEQPCNSSIQLIKSFSQDNNKVDDVFCKSNEKCWGDGVCDPVLNNTKHCFDGGNCLNYKYELDYKEPCSDYECCSRGDWDTGAGATIDLKILKLLQVFGLVLYTFVLNI